MIHLPCSQLTWKLWWTPSGTCGKAFRVYHTFLLQFLHPRQNSTSQQGLESYSRWWLAGSNMLIWARITQFHLSCSDSYSQAAIWPVDQWLVMKMIWILKAAWMNKIIYQAHYLMKQTKMVLLKHPRTWAIHLETLFRYILWWWCKPTFWKLFHLGGCRGEYWPPCSPCFVNDAVHQ